MKLNKNLWDLDINKKPTRDGFGEGLVRAGEIDDRVVALCADLAESTRAIGFKEKFPNRYIEVGVAEQNLASIASGMAHAGKIPFIMSYAVFSPGRNNEQIRTLISLQNLPVKIIGSHAGVNVGPDGATHQALEDIALMRVQPNMTVLSPIDSIEATKATVASLSIDGPVYIRLTRGAVPIITTVETPFEVGKANVLYENEGSKVAFLVTGGLAHNALLAARELGKDNIIVDVVAFHTIKPLDNEAIISVAKKTGSIVVIEEHQQAGGFGSAVAEVLAREYPTRMAFVGVDDKFGQSGTSSELIKYYELDMESIIEKTKDLLSLK